MLCWLLTGQQAVNLHCKFRGGRPKSWALCRLISIEENPRGAFHQHSHQLLAFGVHSTRQLEITSLFIRRCTSPERLHRHQMNLNLNQLIRKTKVSLAWEPWEPAVLSLWVHLLLSIHLVSMKTTHLHIFLLIVCQVFLSRKINEIKIAKTTLKGSVNITEIWLA